MSTKSQSRHLKDSRHVMDKHIYDIQFRVLICKEDGEFVARALEMDLLGTGATEAAAVEHLHEAIAAQLSFATQQNSPEIINFNSDPAYFERWETAQKEAIKGIVSGDKPVKISTRAVLITITGSELRAMRSHQFEPAPLVNA